jgi:hypothetical protein
LPWSGSSLLYLAMTWLQLAVSCHNWATTCCILP